MRPAQRANLRRLFKPRHAAFIGGRDAAVAVGEARRIGYQGAIWPVNPRRGEIGGIPCFASVDALPEAPDAVFLAIPPEPAVDTVRRLRTRGAGGIVCYTAGFREAGEAGRTAERALVEAAGDMALIGPNCYGVLNYLDRVALWPFAHGGWSPGYGAAIITQSGMLSSDLTMSQRSVPLTHMISIGNQAVLTIEALIGELCEMPEVRAIGLHIEGLSDPARFACAALKAIEHGTPVVAMKTGASAIGQALTVSHTGSLSGEDAVYDALFARLGVIRVASPAQLLETLKLLCVAGPVGGRRVAGFTCSGGGATMLADGAEPLGLSFPAFPPDLAERLAGLLPPIATVSNPLDYTTPIWGQACRTGPVFDAALGSGADVAVLVQDYPAPGLDESKPLYRADADAFAAAARRAGVPAVLCSTIPENIDRETREHLAAQGVVPMQGIPEALTAVAQAAEWTAAAARIRVAPPEPLAPAPVPRAPCPCDEAEGKAEVARAGIAVPAGRVVGAAEAPEAAAALGFPVAAKMASPALPHKTEAGAVALGLRSSEAVARAVAEMRGRVARACPAALRDRFLVERMEPAPLAELVLGLRHDPQFGLVLTLGSGGILVELVGDATTLLMPTGPEEIAGAIAGLRAGRLLAGFRGRPAADLATVAGAIHGLARHVAASRGRIAELEINPLFVHERGVVAVDVLMHRADG